MDPILEVARRRGLRVIEDAAQAHGSEYQGPALRVAGRLAGCFSFYPGKNLGAYGEGGAVVTTTTRRSGGHVPRRSAPGARKSATSIVEGIQLPDGRHSGRGPRVKLRHLEAWTEQRRQVARWYDDALDPRGVRLPKERPGCRHVYHVYVVRSDDRDGLRDSLGQRGIQTGIHYPIPVHLQPAHEDLGYHRGDFPVAEAIAREVVSLPIYPEMTREQVQSVAAAVSEACQSRT